MSWRAHGHARVSARSPEAFGKCDRCGMVYNLVDLRYQHEWAGAELVNRRLRVCSSCMDRPQPQLRARRLTQDPVPVKDPRPLNNQAVMGGYAYVTRAPTQFDTEFSSEFAAVSSTALALTLNVVPPQNDIYAQPQPAESNGYDSAEDEGNLPVSIDPS